MLAVWDTMNGTAAGRWLFNRVLAFAIPYSGGVGARVERLAPGECVVTLVERRAVRNHLRSVHAIALANIAELASGLAMSTRLPDGARGIVIRIEIDFLKKARGVLKAQCAVAAFSGELPLESHPVAEVVDQSGTVVARTRVTWRLQHSTLRGSGVPASPPATVTT